MQYILINVTLISTPADSYRCPFSQSCVSRLYAGHKIMQMQVKCFSSSNIRIARLLAVSLTQQSAVFIQYGPENKKHPVRVSYGTGGNAGSPYPEFSAFILFCFFCFESTWPLHVSSLCAGKPPRIHCWWSPQNPAWGEKNIYIYIWSLICCIFLFLRTHPRDSRGWFWSVTYRITIQKWISWQNKI